jgi:hypothetical protein
MKEPLQDRTLAQIATFVKKRWTGRGKQLRWFTPPMSTEDHSADEVTPYSECEDDIVHISIDVKNNDSCYITPALTWKNMQDTRSLITVATCAI